MRGSLFFLLLVSASCTPFSKGPTQVSTYHAACFLAPVEGITVNFTHAQQAIRDFKRQQGHPYSLLYVDLHSGAPLSSSHCIRLVQQAESQFTYYSYQGQKVQSLKVASPTWGQSFAQVGQGHFMGVCDNYATEQAQGIWLVKRDSTVIFSLSISLHEQEGFTGMDKMRVDAARSLLQRILNGKD
jgi:hypothetical protein